MSIELTSFNGEQFHLSDLGWEAVVRLVGTVGFEQEVGRGTRLSAGEAKGFAEAIEKGMEVMQSAARPVVSVEESLELTEEELLPYWFGPKRAGQWNKLVEFLKRGGVRIE